MALKKKKTLSGGSVLKVKASVAPLNFGTQWQYVEALEGSDHVKIEPKYGLFIDGKFVEPHSKKYFDTINPANEKVLSKIAEADAHDVNLAVEAARRSYDNVWSKMSGKERGKYLFRIARIMQERARELAVVETLDGGKPIRESKSVDIPLAAAHFFYYAGWADKLEYAFSGRSPRPLGVAAQVIPWNFPLLMAAWKIAPALATGNTVVLKPAETTPLTALKLAEIFQEADLPPGVVNIITGFGATGAELVSHKGVNKVAFTGSTEVGKKINRAILGTDKRITLELGGKSAHLIFEDASIDQAVEGIVNGIFFNQGHVCCAGSRLLVQESVEKIVLRKLFDRMQTLAVGDPMDKNTDIGAINSHEQMKKIEGYIASGKTEGAKLFQTSCRLPSKGFWAKPTVLSEVAQSFRVVQEEIFGPVLTVQSFRTVEEGIEKANNTPYGLAGGVWTDKGSKIFSVSSHLRAGVVWANTYNKFDPTSPFGGYKESGMGREGGISGLLPYVQF